MLSGIFCGSLRLVGVGVGVVHHEIPLLPQSPYFLHTHWAKVALGSSATAGMTGQNMAGNLKDIRKI
eukprot:CAMPEP_0206494424 /NCGR_PEP_ID=MMETSP0324_2-20121206/47712_1 /ASSEMBLY_ACC=CAM_ASM_000836 /TAXON_ID=2866 /ORGANISM="Crypthecodinium cohnii, Strain Seligo" /LENGTH=66 /DNA_ID=CAMNT_0053978061 /DNA_START=195 /DNA_END=395 /DNA_ORIENTATION=+